jgi:hypothetical protein
MQVEENIINREQRIQHSMDFLCDIIPYSTPNYKEELRNAAEDYIDWEDAGCPSDVETFFEGEPSDEELPF